MILGTIVFFVAVGLFFYCGIKNYVDKVPKITPKSEISVMAGQTMATEDMFAVECKGKYELNLQIIESNIADAKVSDDKQTLYVGSSAGTIKIGVSGYGEVAEPVQEENRITVTLDE